MRLPIARGLFAHRVPEFVGVNCDVVGDLVSVGIRRGYWVCAVCRAWEDGYTISVGVVVHPVESDLRVGDCLPPAVNPDTDCGPWCCCWARGIGWGSGRCCCGLGWWGCCSRGDGGEGDYLV